MSQLKRYLKADRALLYVALFLVNILSAQNNLSINAKITSNSNAEFDIKNAIDGDKNTTWKTDTSSEEKWISLQLEGNAKVNRVSFKISNSKKSQPTEYALQTYMNGRWKDIVRNPFPDNAETVDVPFEKVMLTHEMRLSILSPSNISIHEFQVYGEIYVADLSTLKPILINQSGYNLEKPKRFTAPKVEDGVSFEIKNIKSNTTVFTGKVRSHIGDFSDFNPKSDDEFIITIGDLNSFPFRIGPYWLERVSYQNMIDFLIGARHYVGTTSEFRLKSWAWRDGDFFNWVMQTLVAQYLSNPEAYKRLENKIEYVNNSSFPIEYKGKWGALEPYRKDAPDIVKLMHWDADVKISQKLEHELQKAELAHFLYVYPFVKEWLPQQNFDVVYKYVKEIWEKETVKETSTTIHDISVNHNLLALKTLLGTYKGELPPGHSVIPNLMMYEVAKSQNEKDAEKYFDAAYNQMEWMIANLDWNDPMTTKGQRMSEHVTMRAFAYFYNQYPSQAPRGLKNKVEDWAKVMLRRSQNMWDFRKLTDDGDWAPLGWNETGNVLGFPAAIIAAKSVLANTTLNDKLDIIVWSHFDNAFGRNPVGRHFSFDGPKEIEGVDLGWYTEHHDGIGLLKPVRFVFDGSPKAEHYPNHPELGDIGWTEGWVQFNTAFNMSMGYLANEDTNISITSLSKNKFEIKLKAPLNFDQNKIDTVLVDLKSSNNELIQVKLLEASKYSKYLIGTFNIKNGKLKSGNHSVKVKKGDTLTVSYGLGYFKKEANMIIN